MAKALLHWREGGTEGSMAVYAACRSYTLAARVTGKPEEATCKTCKQLLSERGLIVIKKKGQKNGKRT